MIEEQRDWAKQNFASVEANDGEWHRENIALRIATDNGCEAWKKWQPYWSPAMHFEDRRMLQLETENRNLENRFKTAGIGIAIFAIVLSGVQLLTMTKESLLWKFFS